MDKSHLVFWQIERFQHDRLKPGQIDLIISKDIQLEPILHIGGSYSKLEDCWMKCVYMCVCLGASMSLFVCVYVCVTVWAAYSVRLWSDMIYSKMLMKVRYPSNRKQKSALWQLLKNGLQLPDVENVTLQAHRWRQWQGIKTCTDPLYELQSELLGQSSGCTDASIHLHCIEDMAVGPTMPLCGH